ncbi:hypothetical protein GPJ56_008875 [Histomonas meleagridis]|uniref:uncharacterized protein n=1 Tax=Histomonas meleagridis TaxID=135588 RepID=UPI003559AEC5|nr:hypothetical protein GPJ56_008875 [Histomonas meleagridis]KAH0797801.1 hypothetical protein GO595_009430 [Histomonas meleagridis]
MFAFFFFSITSSRTPTETLDMSSVAEQVFTTIKLVFLIVGIIIAVGIIITIIVVIVLCYCAAKQQEERSSSSSSSKNGKQEYIQYSPPPNTGYAPYPTTQQNQSIPPVYQAPPPQYAV